VKRVTGIMAEITSASAEQTSGIEQINVAVVQMDQVTQQNAALVEEAAAAAASMQEQARGLAEAVSVFKLDAAARSKAAAAQVPSAARAPGRRPLSAPRPA
jgi:methyl-accepting chemotaxis protein